MSNGRTDAIVPTAQAQQLAKMLEECHASVTLAWQPGGHGLTKQDVEIAREWISAR